MQLNLNEIAHHPKAQVVTKFKHAGLKCVVLNMRDRHYCGYVKTPFDGHFEEYQHSVDVHGGLTYGVDDNGWVGFDTAHGLDLPIGPGGTPLRNNPLAELLRGMEDGGYKEWDPEEVVNETAELAEQFAEMAPEGEIQISKEEKVGR